jgi:hypothetical protein
MQPTVFSRKVNANFKAQKLENMATPTPVNSLSILRIRQHFKGVCEIAFIICIRYMRVFLIILAHIMQIVSIGEALKIDLNLEAKSSVV